MTKFKSLLLLPVAVLLAGPVLAAGGPHRPAGALDAILTPEQKAELKAARDAYKAKHQAVMSSLSDEQKQKIATLRTDRRAKVEAILTPEQRTKLQAVSGGKNWREMSDAEKQAARTARREVFSTLTDSQKEAMRALRRGR